MIGDAAPAGAWDAAALSPDLTALDDRFTVAFTDVEMPGGSCRIMHPRNADDLISEADYVKDERLPYWADIWPSSLALARSFSSLSAQPGRVLELGCGLGLVTIAALRAGHDVMATDYYPDALLFARRNAIAAVGRAPGTRMANWRHWPPDAGRFDVVVASDVLYEPAYAGLVAGIISSSLVPDGVAFVADPGRLALPAFLEACDQRGLDVTVRMQVPHHDGAIHQVITIHEIRIRVS
ncbi:MAG: methyltransferase domain-containing protein [Gemmatimonadetes bacterium]|nr:methyltransferase domain-containing protein [Gemmatimonadota bacterium]